MFELTANMIFSKKALLAVAALAASSLAHPGHDPTQEIVERRQFMSSMKRADLSHCAGKLAERGLPARNAARRAARVAAMREKRGLTKRDLDEILNTDHDRTELGYTPETGPEELFAGNTSCLLSPETTDGPYYVGGEYIRTDVAEDQAGIPLYLDYQVIDVDTCEPIPEIHLELWHCNATGVYGGVVAPGNGDINDASNIDNTFLRGIQPTDEDGVATFETIYPGHYTGRTVHVHLLVHTNAEPLQNGTLGNDVTASHVGQGYFDQDLSDAVENNSVYKVNQQPITRNENDFILAQQAQSEGVDPIHDYVLLGDTVDDGIFGWLAFGISRTYTIDIEPAVHYYKEGGVKNPDAGSGFPGFPGPPGGAEAGLATEDQ